MTTINGKVPVYIYPVPGGPAQPSATGTNSGLVGAYVGGVLVSVPIKPTNPNYQP